MPRRAEKRKFTHHLPALMVMLTICAFTCEARAGSVLAGIRARGTVRCGSVERPGLAGASGQGRVSGLNVDVCRAVAAAVLGSPDRIEYRLYRTPKDFDAVRLGRDDLFFLTGSEIREERLAGKLLPGPAVFVESDAVLVPTGSAARRVGDLAGDGICFMIGSSAERSLEAYFETLRKVWLRRAFSEYGEMNDAYNAQSCHALAGELTALAAPRFDPGVNRLASRLLPDPLVSFPVLAATGTGDAQWSAVVAWTVHTLVSSERPEARWYAGAAGAMPIEAPELGLDQDWQRRVLAAVGSYGAIFERNLGAGSPFRLERGPNASHSLGGVLVSPFLE